MRYSFLYLIFFYACNDSSNYKTDEKLQDLSFYYKNELKAALPDNGIVVILQNQRCSACRLSIFQRLTSLLEKNRLPKTFIIAKEDSNLLKIISTLPNSHILIDTSDTRREYGLDYATDLFFLLKKNYIKKWFEISNENLDQIKSLD